MNAAGAGSSKAAAFAMANGIFYMNQLLEKGFTIDEVAPYFMMFLDERSDFFVAVSHIRAARRVWAKTMKEQMRAQKPQSMALKVTAYSHGGETLREPVNNIVRITLAALAYTLGGVQSLYNASYDEVLGPPGEDAAKIALRTQQILAHELGIADTVDPLGGSYYIENLTAQIEKQIYNEIQNVQILGGALAAIEKGYYRAAITDGAIRRQREFDTGEKVVVGVNKFRTYLKDQPGTFRVDPQVEATQVKRLKAVKKERSEKSVNEALAHVRETAGTDENLVPPVLEAVRAYATVGEICDVFREEFGEYQQREYFSPKR
jgi:methylmalonyl-CoA mutase N-terminal domain/subunit